MCVLHGPVSQSSLGMTQARTLLMAWPRGKGPPREDKEDKNAWGCLILHLSQDWGPGSGGQRRQWLRPLLENLPTTSPKACPIPAEPHPTLPGTRGPGMQGVGAHGGHRLPTASVHTSPPSQCGFPNAGPLLCRCCPLPRPRASHSGLPVQPGRITVTQGGQAAWARGSCGRCGCGEVPMGSVLACLHNS